MSSTTWTRRGHVAGRLVAVAGAVTLIGLLFPAAAGAAKGGTGGHKGSLGGSPSTTTTTAPSSTTTTTAPASTTTTTAPAPQPATDTTPPTVSISSPAAGSTVSGTVSVAGSATDNAGVASIRVAVDGAAWQTATGTTSWSWWWSTSGLSNGSHTLSAQAVDTSGNASSVASVTVTVSNSTSSAPNTQGTWTSPEGVTIEVNTSGSWTISLIYSLLKANSLADLSTIGPTITIQVGDSYPSQTTTGCGSINGRYASYSATVFLNGSSGGFVSTPDAVFAHEFGEAWTQYYLCIKQQENWAGYLNERWVSSDGSDTLATDPNTGTSMAWDPLELIADDYRMLFGSAKAISENPYYWNFNMVDPRNEPGLSSWMLNTWA